MRAPAARSSAGDGKTSTRLWLEALAASDDGKGLEPDAALRECVQRVQRVQRALADPAPARTHMDVPVHGADSMVKVLGTEDSPERAPFTAQFDGALARLQADASLSRGDRVGALAARVDLARIGQPEETLQPRLPETLVREVRDTAARMDRELTDGCERMALVTSLAYVGGLNAGAGRSVGRDRRSTIGAIEASGPGRRLRTSQRGPAGPSTGRRCGRCPRWR